MIGHARPHSLTSYGRSAGSARVRAFEWIERQPETWTIHDYLGTADNSPRTLTKHPLRVAAAEGHLRRLAARISGSDTVFLSRQASPLSNGDIETRLLGKAGHGVYDFDDALYLDDRGRFPKSTLWQRAVESADVVIAGNTSLANAASEHNQEVVVIPSCVDLALYKEKLDYAYHESPRAVWIGSPSTEFYLSTIAPALLRVHRTHGLRLTVISGGARSLGDLDSMVDRRSWSVATFADDLAEADFGIMPLDRNPWSEGKCAYKLLQYGAAGLPSIGSPVGANKEVLAHSSGLSAVTEDDWTSALEQLCNEPATQREARGNAARLSTRTYYSFEAWQTTWRAAVGL